MDAVCCNSGFLSANLACSIAAHRIPFFLVCAGPPAAANRELRQARKGATVAATLGAGMWLARTLSLAGLIRPSNAGFFVKQ